MTASNLCEPAWGVKGNGGERISLAGELEPRAYAVIATIARAIRMPKKTASANQLRNFVGLCGGSTMKWLEGSPAWSNGRAAP